MKTKKYILCLALSICALSIKAQIPLENSYLTSDLNIVKLSTAGYKYVSVNVTNNQLNLYNLNHSLYKNITIPTPPSGAGVYYQVKYVSETTFDTDNLLEYAVIYKDNSNNDYYIRIYNEINTLIFSADTASLYNILNTDSGTKMILREFNAGLTKTFKVYGLPGALIAGMIKYEDGLKNIGELFSYPNPTKDYSTIEYKLPQGITNGEIIFYTLNGNEVKRYKVDNTFKNLLIDNTELAAGTYLYHLVTSNSVGESKKIIMIK